MFERQRHLKPPEEERRGHDRDRGYGRALHLAAGAAKPVRPPRQRAVRLVQSQGEQAGISTRRRSSRTNPIRNRRSETIQTPGSRTNKRRDRPADQPATSPEPAPADLLSSPPRGSPPRERTGARPRGRGRGREEQRRRLIWAQALGVSGGGNGDGHEIWEEEGTRRRAHGRKGTEGTGTGRGR
jgi:hypothetical protein